MATKQADFYKTREWEIGDVGQKLVADELMESDEWYVIPSYDYSGDDDKPPRLHGKLKSYVIPDLDIAKTGKRNWAEVKTKSVATYTRMTQRCEHGIPKRHYDDYKEVQKITGCDVWLFILEIATGDILYAKLDELDAVRRTYSGNKMSYGGMVFYPRSAFKLWKNIKPKLEALGLRTPTAPE